MKRNLKFHFLRTLSGWLPNTCRKTTRTALLRRTEPGPSRCWNWVIPLGGKVGAVQRLPHPPGEVPLVEGERHTGNSFVLLFRYHTFSRRGNALPPASTSVVTWANPNVPQATEKMPLGPVDQHTEGSPRSSGWYYCLSPFLSISPSLRGRKSWVKNRNQNLESAHPKNNGSILFQKCLDCWFVYFSSFCEGEYQNFGDKAKLGARGEGERETENAGVCRQRAPLSEPSKCFCSEAPAWGIEIQVSLPQSCI